MRRGHEPSANALWTRYAARLAAYAGQLVGDHAAGDDVAQEVFARILAMPARSLREVRDVPAWLFRIARNQSITHVRKRRRSVGHPPPRRTGIPPDQAEELRAAVDALPRRLREVVVLKHAMGLTLDQIALTLDGNRNTVAARYRDAMEKLRATMVPEGSA